MLNVNNKDTRTTSLSIIQGLKTIAQKWRHQNDVIVFLLLTINISDTFF